jgi:transposase-like protein
MTLMDVYSTFSSDEKCRELLKRLRWPEGPRCLRCGDFGVFKLHTAKDLLYCRPCRFQFTVTSNTIFHDSHLPLLKWFAATLLLCEAKKGMSALQLKRTLGMGYKTAWYLFHRIRKAMSTAERVRLSGKIEMDETYIGGKPPKGSKRGRGTPKEVVIGIRQRGGELRFFHAEDCKSGTLAKYMQDCISADAEVLITDEFSAYPPAVEKSGIDGLEHKTVNHSAGVYAIGDIHTNSAESAFSLLERGIIGSWHKISAKHLPAYLAEMEFRFNRRKRDDLFVDTLRHMITADPMTFENLTHEPDPDFEKVSA